MNERQRRFVDEYLKDRNASRAAVDAGYGVKTARQVAHKLLKIPAIAAAVATAEDARRERVQLDADWVLRRLMLLADADGRKLFTDDGEVRNPATLDDATAYAVAGFEATQAVDGRTTYKMKLADKRAALSDLGRHLGIFRDKVEMEHSGGVTVILNGDEANL